MSFMPDSFICIRKTLYCKHMKLYDKHTFLSDDFNFFFNALLDSCRGKPTLKKKSISKFTELKEKFNLCDIWWIRNPKTKTCTFRQKHVSALIQHFDYFYISNSRQFSVENFDILSSFLTDHLPITFSCCKDEESNIVKSFWKYNNRLIENEEYIHQMKKLVLDTFSKNTLDDHVKWE